MRRLIACGLIALNLLVVSCSKEDLSSNEIDVSFTITEQILDLANEHRISIGKEKLIRSIDADQVADIHTNYMIDQGLISHDNFYKRMEELKDLVNAKAVGENVAFGYASGESVMEGWLNSPGHKANIEGDFTHVGISAIKDENGRYYYTQLFYR
jgi:uncharacterized protein YkwD